MVICSIKNIHMVPGFSPFEALCYTRSETLLLYGHDHLGFCCLLAQLDIAFECKLMSILHTYFVAMCHRHGVVTILQVLEDSESADA